MPYGTIKVDTITFTSSGVDKSVSISGLVQNPTFSGNITSTGTISGVTIQGGTLVSGATVTGSVGQFTNITGGAAGFTTVTGTTVITTTGLFASGTGPLPSITFTGDTDTGFYNPAANTVGITTSGSEKLRIDNVGNVTIDTNTFYLDATNNRIGIGTITPSQSLHVTGNALIGGSPATQYGTLTINTDAAIQAAAPILHFANAAGSTRFAYLNHNGTGGDLFLLNQEAGALRLGTNNSERARIDSFGRLLVGTSTTIASVNRGSTAINPSLQLAGTNGPSSTFGISAFFTDTTFAPALTLAKSNNATVGSHTTVALDNALGEVNFAGSNGTAFLTAASISAFVDAAVSGGGVGDMPGRLVFSTTTDGASSPTERMRITSSGNVGINVTGPVHPLCVDNGNISLFSAGGSAGVRTTERQFLRGDLGSVNGMAAIGMNGTGANGFQGEIKFYTCATDLFNASLSERARIDSSGRLLVGTSSALNTTLLGYGQVQVVGTTNEASQILVGRFSNDNDRPRLHFIKSRAATIGSNTIVQADDCLGRIEYAGADGSSSSGYPIGANIGVFVDGTPASGSMPGRLILGTTASGASTPTERMRITSSGYVGIGQTSPTTPLYISSSSAGLTLDGTTSSFTNYRTNSSSIGYVGDAAFLLTGGSATDIAMRGTSNILFGIGTTERARIDSSGRLLVGASSSITAVTFPCLVQTNSFYSYQSSLFSADANGSNMFFLKSRNATVGSHTILQANDVLGQTQYAGSDGNTFLTAAAISAAVDGTPASGTIPGRLTFATTISGAASPSVRMTITSSGNVGIGDTGPDNHFGTEHRLVVRKDQNAPTRMSVTNGTIGANAFAMYRLIGGTANSYAVFGLADNNGTPYSYIDGGAGVQEFRLNVTGNERLRIDSSGRLLVGTSSAITALGFQAGVQFTNQDGTALFVRNSNDSAGVEINAIKSRGGSLAGATALVSGDTIAIRRFAGYDGSAYTEAARIGVSIDGTTATGVMPGRIIFSTTPATSGSTIVERMRIDSSGRVGIGATPTTECVVVARNIDGGTAAYGYSLVSTIQSGVTTSANGYLSSVGTASGTFTLGEIRHFNVSQGTFGSGSTVTNQYGYFASANITGATNNYGFYGNVASGVNRWNFYAGSTADSFFASNNFIFANGGTEKARFDSSGRLLVGTSSATNVSGLANPAFQVQSTGTSALACYNWDSSGANGGGELYLLKSKSGTVGTQSVVAASDILGSVRFLGSDGTNHIQAALLKAEVDGTPGTNDMPGRLVFSTTLDGASSPTEAFRITNDRVQCYNQAAPAAVDTTATLTVANLKTGIITSTTAAAVTMTLPLGTDTEAGFSGIYTNMTFEWSVINTGATNAVTINGNTGHTIVGSATVAASNSGRFATRRTAANTFVTYRLSS